MVTSIWKGWSKSATGGSTRCTMVSSSGVMSLDGSSRSRVAYPSLPDAYTMGKSSCSSVAFSSQNRSKVMSATSSGRALGRSSLLMTTIGLRCSSSDFLSTNLVCGMGPSKASTSSSTPSTMLQNALHLAAEIGVPRGVDDVEW